jgi:signal recognition particle receptor subunit beta
MKVKFQLYTVPGQVYDNSTRKLVLRGADGVVFVADSNPAKMEENLESLRQPRGRLREQGRTLAEIPHVIQFNKRDLPGAMSTDEMRAALARDGAPCFEACGASAPASSRRSRGCRCSSFNA